MSLHVVAGRLEREERVVFRLRGQWNPGAVKMTLMSDTGLTFRPHQMRKRIETYKCIQNFNNAYEHILYTNVPISYPFPQSPIPSPPSTRLYFRRTANEAVEANHTKGPTCAMHCERVCVVVRDYQLHPLPFLALSFSLILSLCQFSLYTVLCSV